MSTSKRGRPPGSKNKPKVAATNSKRDLAAIAGDIHTLERRNVFEIGKLLIEAHDACEHGEWGNWLDREFDWSDDTAGRYMAASRLADKFRTVRNLKIPARTLYDLADDLEDADLPAIIEALGRTSKAKALSVARAEEVIDLTRLRLAYGNYPTATLHALDDLNGDEWAKQASEKLKEVRPETDEEAERIVDTYRPPAPEIEPDDQDAGGEDDADEPPPRPAPKPPRPEPETQETDPAQATAAAAARNDIGPFSASEHERLTRTIADPDEPGQHAENRDRRP
jgi:hypothetical protein